MLSQELSAPHPTFRWQKGASGKGHAWSAQAPYHVRVKGGKLVQGIVSKLVQRR